jgi:flavorubredoxin
MEAPTLFGAHSVAPDTTSLSSYCPLPGVGLLPVNAFVIHAAQPILVDTGLTALREPFLEALRATIDPAAIRWIWISHMDADHVGNIEEVMAMAPEAKVITTVLGLGKMMLRGFDVSRVHLLEHGAVIHAGDRTLVPLKPVCYDAPETMGFFDTRTRVLFAADTFGTPLQTPQQVAAAIPEVELFDGMATWAALDMPALGMCDRAVMGRLLAAIDRLDPAAIVSAHLPVARGMTSQLLRVLDRVLDSGRIAAPDCETLARLAPPHALAA